MSAFLTIVLVLLSLFLVLLILLQRSSGGMGSALGGGAADQVFGGGTAAVQTKWTLWGVLGFFLIAFALYLIYQSGAGSQSAPNPNQTVVPQAPPNQGGNASTVEPSVDIPPADPVPDLPPGAPEANASTPEGTPPVQKSDENASKPKPTEPKAPATPGPKGGE